MHAKQSLHFCSSALVPQVLHCCVAGSNLHTQQSHYLLTLSDLSSDYDLMLGQVKRCEPPPSQTPTMDLGNLLTVAEGKGRKMSFPKSESVLRKIALHKKVKC